MNDPKQQTMYTGYGEGCLFEQAFIDLSSVGEWNREVPAFLQRIEASGDQRLMCIMGSLVAEHHVERFLRTVLPKYDLLEENRDFTFSMKTNFIEALHLLPSHIVKALHIVRAVRNEFAHSLDLVSVDDLKQKLRDRIRSVYDHTYSRYEKPGAPPPSVGKTTLEMHKQVINLAIMGCRSYEPTLRLFGTVIRSGDFQTYLATIARQQLEAQMQALRALPGTPPQSPPQVT